MDKWKEYLLSDQGVRKNINWKKTLEDTCKYGNVIIRDVSTSATSGKKIDYMRKEFSIDQVRYMPFWLEDSKKLYFNSSSNIPFIDVRNLNRKQNLVYTNVRNHFRNSVSSPLLRMITGGSSKSPVINALRNFS